jgi:hypothetical protein
MFTSINIGFSLPSLNKVKTWQWFCLSVDKTRCKQNKQEIKPTYYWNKNLKNLTKKLYLLNLYVRGCSNKNKINSKV